MHTLAVCLTALVLGVDAQGTKLSKKLCHEVNLGACLLAGTKVEGAAQLEPNACAACFVIQVAEPEAAAEGTALDRSCFGRPSTTLLGVFPKKE